MPAHSNIATMTVITGIGSKLYSVYDTKMSRLETLKCETRSLVLTERLCNSVTFSCIKSSLNITLQMNTLQI